MELTVTEGSAPVRLDAFLHDAMPAVSRRLVRRLIAEGEVRVNGRAAAKGVRLRGGDRVTVPALPAGVAPEPGLALPIVAEDEHLMVVDKPGGMPSHALDPRRGGTAAAFIVARHPETAGVGDPLAPGLVHRLDTGTSGLLVAARTAEAFAVLRATFRAHRVEKRYLAIVDGDARDVHGVSIDLDLAHDPCDRRRMIAATPGLHSWRAETTLALRARAAGRSLVEATIRTGVTHQVRVHLASVGHPVVGDVLYGGDPDALPAGRHALHAAHLHLPHPATDHNLELESPLPPDLEMLLG